MAFDPNRGSCSWIVIGSSKCGKSTILNYLSNDNIATSSTTESCTVDISEYTCTLPGVHLIDTVGDLDSSCLMTSSEILHKICAFLGPRGVSKVKILWFVTPDLCKSSVLQNQASFIRKLSIHGNIWNSVVIIGKKADKMEMKGARAAARDYGCKTLLPACGMYLLDKIEGAKSRIGFKFLFKTPYLKRVEIHDEKTKVAYLMDKEVKTFLVEEMSKVESTQIRMKKEYYHTGEKRRDMYHPGIYKMGSWNKAGFWTLGILTVGIGNGIAAIGDGHESCRQWRCCGKTDRYAAACKVKREYWSCCNKDVSHHGCKWKWVPEGN